MPPGALRLGLLGLALLALPCCAVLTGPGATPNQFPLAFVTEPLDINMTGQDRGEDDSLRDDTRHIVLNGAADVHWGRNGVGHIAEMYGLDGVRYADVETRSILGIWTQRYVHVYGTSSPEARETLKQNRAAGYSSSR